MEHIIVEYPIEELVIRCGTESTINSAMAGNTARVRSYRTCYDISPVLGSRQSTAVELLVVTKRHIT